MTGGTRGIGQAIADTLHRLGANLILTGTDPETVPVGRLARPEEIATTVAFLASSSNTYISGQSHLVDGGYGLG